jgi:nitrate reductase / nitrite oxidoreductase, beta subunit
MRAYMRAKTVDGVIDTAVAAKVGLEPEQIEDMYHVMAIANYEDRFVIPTAHRETSEDAYQLRGACGFSFGNGCSPDDGGNLFAGGKLKAKNPMEVA